MGRLKVGSTARLYRDGIDDSAHLLGQVIVPRGRMEVRHLDPGTYLARDEEQNEITFVVTALEEAAVVQGAADPDGTVAGPGSANVDSSPVQLVGDEHERSEPTFPAGGSRIAPKEDIRQDLERIPAGPGSVLVTEAPEEAEPQWRREGRNMPEGPAPGETGQDSVNAVAVEGDVTPEPQPVEEQPTVPPAERAAETPAAPNPEARKPAAKTPATAKRRQERAGAGQKRAQRPPAGDSSRVQKQR